MITNKDEWNNSFSELKSVIKKRDNISRIVELLTELHRYTHESEKNKQLVTLEDEFWKISGDFRNFSEKKLFSAAWHLWHSARVEDITCSCFICNTKEIIDELDFLKAMGVSFRHTGNSLNFQQMQEFNQKINIDELRNYRKEVGKKTQVAIKSLTIDKLFEKVKAESLSYIQEVGSVSPDDGWLLDYWGKKTISGILLMPLTRHLLVHLNSAIRMM